MKRQRNIIFIYFSLTESGGQRLARKRDGEMRIFSESVFFCENFTFLFSLNFHSLSRLLALIREKLSEKLENSVFFTTAINLR
jgi:hypothetical protein